jgi:hypothetical protein
MKDQRKTQVARNEYRHHMTHPLHPVLPTPTLYCIYPPLAVGLPFLILASVAYYYKHCNPLKKYTQHSVTHIFSLATQVGHVEIPKSHVRPARGSLPLLTLHLCQHS